MIKIRTAEERDAKAIVTELRIGFHDKYAHLFCGNEELGTKLLLDYYAKVGKEYLNDHFVATDGERVVGVIRVLFPHIKLEMPSSIFSLFHLMKKFGFLGGIKVKIGLGIADTDEFDKDSAYIEFLCVLPEYRNQGIGSRLLDKAESFTKTRNLNKISLYVFETNNLARSLYEREGYKEVRRVSSIIAQWLLGFKTVIYMKKSI